MNLGLLIAIKTGPGTIVRLAGQTGLRRERISRILNGRIPPSERDRKLIAEALGESPRVLFGG